MWVWGGWMCDVCVCVLQLVYSDYGVVGQNYNGRLIALYQNEHLFVGEDPRAYVCFLMFISFRISHFGRICLLSSSNYVFN